MQCGQKQKKNESELLTNTYKCPICKDSGWEEIEQDGYTFLRECKCGIRQKTIMKNRLSFANIPESFVDMSISSFDTNLYKRTESRNKALEMVKAIKYWLTNFEAMYERGMGLYMYSESKGSGKTRMAASIANELIHNKQVQVKFSTSLQILNEIKASWEGKEYSESKLLDFLSTTPVLIIDDFGTEQQGKDWINERFNHIINSRYVDKKITIFTSNTRIDLLKCDERISNRIKERSFQIQFPEESVRDIIARDNMIELINGIKG